MTSAAAQAQKILAAFQQPQPPSVHQLPPMQQQMRQDAPPSPGTAGGFSFGGGASSSASGAHSLGPFGGFSSLMPTPNILSPEGQRQGQM